MSNFKPVTNFWFWCQKVLPLVYDDSISYYEVLCKMSEYLNQVINNVNALPDIIDDAVKEYIESGEIQKVLNEMLQNFNPINVKIPPAGLTPAKGDGETDDTAALQAMIEYGAEYNLPMIFPAGVYRVTSLNVPETAYFLGVGNPTIFKAPNSENALITVAGDFTAFNINFNGNIGGNIAPADIITGTAENISLAQCNFTGCVSCVDANISGILDVMKCHFSNYTDYAIHAEGAGRLMVDGMEVDSVANSGAMRFVRINTSNSIVKNLTSLANVPVGVEIAGDFNSVEARIPNCKNPVNDGGQNNSYDIIGQTMQKKVTGKMTYAASESEETMGSKKVINAKDIVLNPVNPLTYKTPTEIEDTNRGYITFKDNNGIEYDIPTFALNYLKNIGLRNYKTIFEYGAVGDGVHDDTQAFIVALNDTKCNTTFIPSGYDYVVHGDYTTPVNHILITDGPINTADMTGSLQELIPVEPGLRVIDTNANEWSGERKTYFFRSADAGEKGFTKHGTWFQGFNQSESDNFVWNVLITLDTSCKGESDDVALYVAANGTDGTDTALWAIATSTKDGTEGNPSYPKLGQEIAVQAKGDDANDMRHGLNIVMTPIANTVGANFGSFILLTGGDTGNSPGKIKRAFCLGTMKVDAILAARENSNIQCTRGIDFSNMNFSDCAFYLVQGHKFRIDNFSFWEQGGELHLLRGGEQYIDSGKIYFDSSDHGHLQLNSVDITFNPVEWSGTSGATRALPVSIGGQNFYLPLFPA